MRKINYKLALIVAMITVSVTTNPVVAQDKKSKAKETTTTAAETSPTKEETIAWLMEKLVKYFDYGPIGDLECVDKDKNNSAKNLLIQLNECELTIASIYDLGNHPNSATYCNIKDFIPITNIIIGDDGRIRCKINGIYSIYKSTSGLSSVTSSFSKKKALTFCSVGVIINGEVDLYKKMQKAFDHLATFCPKKKELF